MVKDVIYDYLLNIHAFIYPKRHTEYTNEDTKHGFDWCSK